MVRRNLFDERSQRGLLRYWFLRGGGIGAMIGLIAAAGRLGSRGDWTEFVILPAFVAFMICCFITIIRTFVRGDVGVGLWQDW